MSEARHASYAPGLADTPSRLMLPEGMPLIGWLVLSRIGLARCASGPEVFVSGGWACASAAVYGLGHMRNGDGKLFLVCQKSRIRRIAGDALLASLGVIDVSVSEDRGELRP